MRKNSVKNNRINQEVLRYLSEAIRADIKDPRIAPMTSVVAVEVAPDLKTAKVYVSVLGDKEAQANTLKGLKSATPFLKCTLAKKLNLRNTPELYFHVDQSIEYGVNMQKLINQVIAEMPQRDDEEDAEDGSEDDL